MDDFATGYLAGQDGGNNNGGFFGNEGLWAVIILAIIFGWGTNGYGRNGGDNGMNAYIPYLVGTGATGQGGNDTRAALSEGFYQQDTSRSLAGIQSGICSLGYDQLAQMNGVNTNIANGFAGVNSAICQLGYQNAQLVNGLERSVSNGDNAINLAIMQEGNARQAGQTALATQLASCCCENKQLIGDLKYTIATEDCATRQAIADNARAILDALTAQRIEAKDAKIAEQGQQLFAAQLAASQAAQNETLKAYMSGQLAYYNPRPVPAFQVPAPYQYGNCGTGCGCGSCA